MVDELPLNDAQLDALKEIGNVGTGQAATALSKMLSKSVAMNIPETRFIPYSHFVDVIGDPEEIVSGIYLETQGDIKGQTLFMFDKKSALYLVDLMMFQDPGTTKEFDEMAESAFKEMSNIFTGAYLSSLGDMLGKIIMPGIPNVAEDMAQAIIDGVLSHLSRKSDQILYVKTLIDIEGHEINGIFLLFFDPESLNIVLDILEEKFGVPK